MTREEANTLAAEIAERLRALGAGFLLTIEWEEEALSGGAWQVGGCNHSSLANMLTSVMGGIVAQTAPSDCETCNDAYAGIRSALLQLTPHGAPARTCH